VPVLLCLAAAPVRGATATQSLALEPGWNAVWLEVDPVYTNGAAAGTARPVEEVFADPAIAYVATPRLPVGTAEFIAESAAGVFNQADWRTWQRSSELGQDTLAVIRGYQAYLVKVSGVDPVTINITGEARFVAPAWNANAYNLLGFQLTGTVSFEAFFDGFTLKHPVNKIFRLAADGNWSGVQGTDLMEPGEAYWIYAQGQSTFNGPVAIAFEDFDGLNFGPGPGEVEVDDPDGGVGGIFITLREVTFTERTAAPRTVSIEKVSPDGALPATDALRIYDITPQPDALDYAIGSQITDTIVASLDAGGTETVTLGAHRNWSSGARERENLYRLVIGKQFHWLPARAQNADLIDYAPDDQAEGIAGYQGLWIGDAIVNEVTSVSESGRPLRNTTTSAPLRFLFHVDAAGAVSLLSHVTVMQEKRASEEIEPSVVLVVDDAKIPIFEGIEERGGVRAGKRFESIAYDLRRKADLTTQSALLDDVADLTDTDGIELPGDVTENDLANFINSRDGRPPELVEAYHLTWPLEGAFGPNNAVQTPAEAPLLLDPLHRGNPFRHAFHRRHVAGFPITRGITIGFDREQSDGRLTGVYTETLGGAGGVAGLASFDIVTRGRITLTRISTVGTVE
jgi:hypothetical protein